MSMKTWRLLPLLAAALLAGCAADDEEITGLEPVGGADVLARYVSLGNSLTAGMQSGGINDSLQMLAYPVLVARQAGVPFTVPLLRSPGCPPPYTQPVVLDTARLGMAQGAPACALRAEAVAPRSVQNVAYPGAFVGSAIDNAVSSPTGGDVYKTLILGGRNQLQAMADARPTLVSVWLGSNETLLPAVQANMDLLVPLAAFEAGLDSIVRAIRATPARDDAILIAPGNALSITPLVQPGVYLWALQQDPAGRALLQRAGKTVSNDCAPTALGGRGDQVLVSLRVMLALPAQMSTISCTDPFPGVLTREEIQVYQQRYAQYVQAVRVRAEQNNWIFIDPSVELADAVADPSKFRLCQGLRSGTPPATPAQFAQAVATTCPGPSAPNFFGSWVSFDATHPTAAFHQAFANVIIGKLNQKYGSTIPTL